MRKEETSKLTSEAKSVDQLMYNNAKGTGPIRVLQGGHKILRFKPWELQWKLHTNNSEYDLPEFTWCEVDKANSRPSFLQCKLPNFHAQKSLPLLYINPNRNSEQITH